METFMGRIVKRNSPARISTETAPQPDLMQLADHEKTITIGPEKQTGKYHNIPTVIEGQEVPKKDAIDYFRKTGKDFGSFDSLDEADKAAKKRSRESQPQD